MTQKKHVVMFHGFPISKGSQGDAYRAGLEDVKAQNNGTITPAILSERIAKHRDLLDRLHGADPPGKLLSEDCECGRPAAHVWKSGTLEDGRFAEIPVCDECLASYQSVTAEDLPQ